MRAIVYWGFIAICGIIHLQNMAGLLNYSLLMFLTVFITIAIAFFLFIKTPLHISHIGIRWNIFLFTMQLLQLAIYLFDVSYFINMVLFLNFIGIELVRLKISHKLRNLQREIRDSNEQFEQLNEAFRIVRSERHDFLKHISALHFMLDNKKQEEALKYLNHLVDGYEETNLSIKGENGSVAGILHQSYKKAKNIGIEVAYDIDLPLSSLPLPDTDIVALIGNLLSNSIDACEEWQRERENRGRLTLQFYKRSGLYLLICKNDSLPLPTSIIDGLFHSFGTTTKGEEHEGLGTKIIYDIVHKYQGYLDFIHKDEEFTVKIKIPAIQNGS